MKQSEPNPYSTRHIRNGDTGTFDRLYAELGSRVLGYLIRLTENRAEAEDLLQETFLAAYTGRASFAGKSQPLTWLLGIARRRWRDRMRQPAPLSVAMTEAVAETIDTGQESLCDTVTRSALLEDALSRLDTPTREVVTIVFILGLSYREAAEVVGEPTGTVGWRISEAMKKMRRTLEGYEESEESHAARAVTRTTYSPCRR